MDATCETQSEIQNALVCPNIFEPTRHPICPKRRNTHLSVSRCKLYEQCPRAYAERYVNKVPGTTSIATEFGKLLHAVFESLFEWVVENEHSGALPLDVALDLYRKHWSSFELRSEDVTNGVQTFQEGAQIVRDYVLSHPPVDHFDILDTEMEFNIRIGDFLVNGYIDRVDKIDDDAVRIIDYKSNRVLFSGDELESDLQMSIYALAVMERWPWVKRIEYAFHMVRMNIIQRTTRTEAQLSFAAQYIQLLGREMEDSEFFPAILNSNCSYCDHRTGCPVFQLAVDGKNEKIVLQRDDLEAVSRSREQAHKLAKIFYARKKETEEIIRAAIEEHGEVVTNGMRYKISNINHKEYLVEPTVAVLVRFGGLSREEARRRLTVLTVDKKALDAILDDLKAESYSKHRAVEAALDSIAQITVGTRFDAHAIKGESRGKLLSTAKPKALPPKQEEIIRVIHEGILEDP